MEVNDNERATMNKPKLRVGTIITIILILIGWIGSYAILQYKVACAETSITEVDEKIDISVEKIQKDIKCINADVGEVKTELAQINQSVDDISKNVDFLVKEFIKRGM